MSPGQSRYREECPRCRGELVLKRKVQHPDRPEYEIHTLGCTKCEYTLKRTVDAGDDPLR